jgi:signal transduction histidine kinase
LTDRAEGAPPAAAAAPAESVVVVERGRIRRPFTPAPPEFRVTHVLLFAAVAVPGLLLTATGIVGLALHRFAVDIVLGILTLAFSMWVVVGGLSAYLLVKRSERKTRLQHDFVSNVSHELRTPLTGIRVLVETLRLGRVGPEERERCMELLEGATSRLTVLVEEILEFGRLSAGVREVELRAESLAEVVEAALADYEALHLSAAVEVVRAIDPSLTALADRRALAQVLVNLLSNAAKYAGGPGRHVWVRAAGDGRRVQLSVEDDGPGVPLAARRRIFQEFVRGDDEATLAKPGTGLGLAIAQRLVEAQRGTIRMEPRAGGGSRFVVSLEVPE